MMVKVTQNGEEIERPSKKGDDVHKAAVTGDTVYVNETRLTFGDSLFSSSLDSAATLSKTPAAPRSTF